MSEKLVMKFDPKTIEHLGVRMYSTLPPALAELISNAYDADAVNARISLNEKLSGPISITAIDDGHGMNSSDIQNKSLVIGRNRRKQEGDKPTDRFKCLATGKKGLGKFALFGLSKHITIDTIRDGIRNRFSLDWDSLMTSEGEYSPQIEIDNEKTDHPNGTSIKLSKLKRQSVFDTEGLADSLSKIFISDKNFNITITNGDQKALVNEERHYVNSNKQFEWDMQEVNPKDPPYPNLEGVFYTAEIPIRPNFGLRGIPIFSRGKLVNAPEFFSSSTSSYFYQYLTGWIRADFVDEPEEDVISTNRQSINWDNEDMAEFRRFLSEIISKVNPSWREKRKKKKDDEILVETGIDTQKWMSTMPEDVRSETSKIIDAVSSEEAVAKYTPTTEALHKLVPEYPHLHRRHLTPDLRDRVSIYYKNEQYGEAADQGVKIYCQKICEVTGLNEDGTELVGKALGGKLPILMVVDNNPVSGKSIQLGQEQLSCGLIAAFRNPINHAPIDSVVLNTFSEKDCLDILSLISYPLNRIQNYRHKS